ncbi:MAG TPA: type II toxin-antitoxin system HicA family toxin [Opitutaceae bacterium]|nr:type II toxin-antitoxin system HicA family toxin [Opitutaceae bacterium]
MPKPVSRREFIRRFRALGWEGPFPGGRHDAMRHPQTGLKVPVPNPHRGDIDWSLTKRILAQAEIEPADWDNAGR